MESVGLSSGAILNKAVRKTSLIRCYLSKHCSEVRKEAKWTSGEESQIPHSIFDFIGTLKKQSVHVILLMAGILTEGGNYRSEEFKVPFWKYAFFSQICSSPLLFPDNSLFLILSYYSFFLCI